MRTDLTDQNEDLLTYEVSDEALETAVGINEFKVIDDHENEYALIEYRNATETPSLKLLTVGRSWFALADGTPVDQVDDEAFRIESSGTVLRRRKSTHSLSG